MPASSSRCARSLASRRSMCGSTLPKHCRQVRRVGYVPVRPTRPTHLSRNSSDPLRDSSRIRCSRICPLRCLPVRRPRSGSRCLLRRDPSRPVPRDSLVSLRTRKVATMPFRIRVVPRLRAGHAIVKGDQLAQYGREATRQVLRPFVRSGPLLGGAGEHRPSACRSQTERHPDSGLRTY